MKTPITIAFLAAILLAGCNKDPDYSYIPPTPAPIPRPVAPLPDEKNGFVFTVLDGTTNTFQFVRLNTLGIGPYAFVNQSFPVGNIEGYPAVSEDGESVVYFIEDSVFVMDVNSGANTFLYEHANSSLRFAAISDDGSKIAFSASPGNNDRADIYVMDAVIGAQPVNLTNNNVQTYSTRPSFNNDGSTVVFSTSVGMDNAINMCNTQGGQVIRVSDDVVSGNDDQYPVFSRDGSRVLFSTNRYTSSDGPLFTELFIADANSGGESQGFRLTYLSDSWFDTYTVHYPTMSTDGETIYFLGKYAYAWTIWRVTEATAGAETVVVANVIPYYQTVMNFSFVATK